MDEFDAEFGDGAALLSVGDPGAEGVAEAGARAPTAPACSAGFCAGSTRAAFANGKPARERQTPSAADTAGRSHGAGGPSEANGDGGDPAPPTCAGPQPSLGLQNGRDGEAAYWRKAALVDAARLLPVVLWQTGGAGRALGEAMGEEAPWNVEATKAWRRIELPGATIVFSAPNLGSK